MYVDPSSKEPTEFGTMQYPYKSLAPPFKELFNKLHGAPESTPFQVLLKEGTTFYLSETLATHGRGSLTLTTYSSTTPDEPSEANIVVTNQDVIMSPSATQLSVADAALDTFDPSVHPTLSSKEASMIDSGTYGLLVVRS